MFYGLEGILYCHTVVATGTPTPSDGVSKFRQSCPSVSTDHDRCHDGDGKRAGTATEAPAGTVTGRSLAYPISYGQTAKDHSDRPSSPFSSVLGLLTTGSLFFAVSLQSFTLPEGSASVSSVDSSGRTGSASWPNDLQSGVSRRPSLAASFTSPVVKPSPVCVHWPVPDV